MDNIGIGQEKINDILEKYGIEEGNHINLEDVKSAISEIVIENNKTLDDYLEHDYRDFIMKTLNDAFKH